MFHDGLDIQHEAVLRVLEVMWMKFVDDASHYQPHSPGPHSTRHYGGGGGTGLNSPSGSVASGGDGRHFFGSNGGGGGGGGVNALSGGGQKHGQQLHGHRHLGRKNNVYSTGVALFCFLCTLVTCAYLCCIFSSNIF
jgi:hypothetical protein